MSIFWLGGSASPEGARATPVANVAALPEDCGGALVVQPVALDETALYELAAQVKARGGRLVAVPPTHLENPPPVHYVAPELCTGAELCRQLADLERGALTALHLRVRTLDDAEVAAHVVARAIADRPYVVTGLVELLVNAVEHGSAELNSEDKRRAVLDGTWRQEVERRLSLPGARERSVRLDFTVAPDVYRVVIEDEGPGFDHAAADFTLVGDGLLGRGIALARAISFDDLRFEGRGNRVVGTINRT